MKQLDAWGENSVGTPFFCVCLLSSHAQGIRAWTYMTCSEFGFFQTTDSDKQPFGNLVPISFYTGILLCLSPRCLQGSNGCSLTPQTCARTSLDSTTSLALLKYALYLSCKLSRNPLNDRQTNIHYGGLNVVSSNIVFVNGGIDPWHSLSVIEDISGASPQSAVGSTAPLKAPATHGPDTVTAIFIPGGSHCENMSPANQNSPKVAQSRENHQPSPTVLT